MRRSLERFLCWKRFCFFFLIVQNAHAAHSRRRIEVAKNTNSQQRYDRSITTFDPSGRLLQVEYSIEATKRGENIMAFLADDGSIVVLVAQPKERATRSAKVHRIDDHLWLFTAGLSGDARTLAAYLRSSARQHKLSYGEPMTVEEAAQQSAATQHTLTRFGGARPLGCTAIVLGRNPSHGETIGPSRLFRTDPGGGLEDCYFCCAGRDQDRLLSNLIDRYEKIRKRTLPEIIQKLVGYMLQGQNRSKTCLDVWVLRPDHRKRAKSDVTCFTEVSSAETLKTIASYLGSR